MLCYLQRENVVLLVCCALYRTLGTPTNQVWPGVTDLQDYKSTFPKWNSQDLTVVMKNQLTTAGIDVLKV